MKRCIVLAVALLGLLPSPTHADEGMWLLPNVDSTLIQRLNKRGFQRINDLARYPAPSMQEAVVKLGTGCTGSIVSRSGLVLTNYHCIANALEQYGHTNQHVLEEGFYATSQTDEFPIEGMTVAITTGMRDVTKEVRNGIPPSATLSEAQAQISKNIAGILDTLSLPDHVEAHIAAQFAGNRYLLITRKIFRDVRLVLAPPASIGKFGGDTDNWTFPRHTGDFALLRIYSNPSNEPADYAPQNVPYKASSLLSISQDGYQENDLTIVMGYPATTQRYATADEIAHNRDNIQRAYIDAWERLIPIWDSLTSANPNSAPAFLALRERAANYLKYYQMQRRAIDTHGIIKQREDDALKFCAWYATDPSLKDKYFGAISDIKQGFESAKDLNYQYTLLREALRSGMPLTNLAATFARLVATAEANGKASSDDLKTIFDSSTINSAFDRVEAKADQTTTAAMLTLCMEKLPQEEWPATLQTLRGSSSLNAFLSKAYANSIFASRENALKFAASPSLKKLKKDPLWLLATSIQDKLGELQQRLLPATKLLQNGQQRYIAGLLEQHSDSTFYPDADGTLRLSYGQVKGLSPSDGVHLNYFTTVTGMAQKAQTGKPEYKMDALLAKLEKHKAFSGFQNENNVMPLNFITTNDITGGNSGSPVLDKQGALIGLAFDGNSENVIGQYSFDSERTRSICVDIRFMLLYAKIQKNTRVFDELSIFGKRPSR